MGAIPQVPTVYEVLEEMAITVSCWVHFPASHLPQKLNLSWPPITVKTATSEVVLTVISGIQLLLARSANQHYITCNSHKQHDLAWSSS